MAFFADIRAAKDVLRIKNGGFASLSISQITNLIINLPDAKKNLPADQFEKVHSLFKELRQCSTPVKMDFEGYIDTAVKIIRRFDAIAPYEKYSGGNELETSFMMEDIRQSSPPPKQSAETVDAISLDNEDMEYVNYIVQNGRNIRISQNEAETIVKIITLYHTVGKSASLTAFDSFALSIIQNDTIYKAYSIMKIPFFTSLLHTNGVLSEIESSDLNNKYVELSSQRLKALATEEQENL